MTKIIVYVASSLDGFIARENGDVDWLIDDPSYDFYERFIKDIGIIIMGKGSYDKVVSLCEDWPYKGQMSFVFTHEERNDEEKIKFISGDVSEFIENIEIPKDMDIWVMGGRDIIQQFLEKGLVDEMIIGIMPMTLGKGIPLFSDCGERELELLGIDKYEKGMVQLHYKILG